MIRVLLAEDQGMLRGAVATLLGLEDDIEVVAQVGRGDEVVAACAEHEVDVAVLDIEMPGASGLDAAEALARDLPAVRVVMVTTFGRPGFVHRAMTSGVAGFLLKDGPVEDLAAALRTVHAGGTVIDPVLATQALRSGASPLTAREREVLISSGDGASIADLARRHHLSESTVRNYLSAAIGKLGVRNRAEAHRTARDAGWL